MKNLGNEKREMKADTLIIIRVLAYGYEKDYYELNVYTVFIYNTLTLLGTCLGRL